MAKTLEQTIGQLIIAGFRESTITPKLDIVRCIKDYNISGVILYDEDMENKRNKTRNVISQRQLQNLTKGLQDSSDNPLLISIDQEGGKVNRLKKRYGFPGSRTFSLTYLLFLPPDQLKLEEGCLNYLVDLWLNFEVDVVISHFSFYFFCFPYPHHRG